VAGIEEFDLHTVSDEDRPVITDRHELVHGPNDVEFVVERLPVEFLIPFLGLPREVIRIALLDVRGIGHDEVCQVPCRRGGVDRTLKALLHKVGHKAAVVVVCMGKHKRID